MLAPPMHKDIRSFFGAKPAAKKAKKKAGAKKGAKKKAPAAAGRSIKSSPPVRKGSSSGSSKGVLGTAEAAHHWLPACGLAGSWGRR